MSIEVSSRTRTTKPVVYDPGGRKSLFQKMSTEALDESTRNGMTGEQQVEAVGELIRRMSNDIIAPSSKDDKNNLVGKVLGFFKLG